MAATSAGPALSEEGVVGPLSGGAMEALDNGMKEVFFALHDYVKKERVK